MDLKNKEAVMAHLEDTITHKQFILSSGLIMIRYLFDNERISDALDLAKRISVHDHSKLASDEIDHFIQMPIKKKGRKPNGRLTEDQRKLLKIHWSKNRHHPEFHEDYTQMTEIDVLEMVCDWHARSTQFESNLMEFVEDVVKERFKFDDEFYKKVYDYCMILYSSSKDQ